MDHSRPYESWVAFWIAVAVGHFIDIFRYRLGEAAQQRKALAQIAWDTELVKRGVRELPGSRYLPYTNTRRLAHANYFYALLLILFFIFAVRFFFGLFSGSEVDSSDSEVVAKSFDFSSDGWK